MHASPQARNIDYGRLIVVPFAALMLALNADALVYGAKQSPLRLATTALTGLFYTLIIWCYLRRRPAIATSTSTTAHVAAVLGTLAPLLIPLLGHQARTSGRLLVADALLLAGTGWAMWSLRYLGRNISVIAQVRQIADKGPYRWIRHPLYTGEIVSALGLVVATGTAGAVAAWVALVGLQVYRALREEQLLVAALPGYSDYRARTSALIPGLRLPSRTARHSQPRETSATGVRPLVAAETDPASELPVRG